MFVSVVIGKFTYLFEVNDSVTNCDHSKMYIFGFVFLYRCVLL